MMPWTKKLYAVRVDRPDLLALKIIARRQRTKVAELVRQAIKQIIRDAA